MKIPEILKDRRFLKILVLAVLIRLLLMPFFFHPDIKTYHFQVSHLRQGVFDFYQYSDANKDRMPIKEEFVYFPLTYFFLGGYQTVIQPLAGPGFDEWLKDASQAASERVGVYRYLFLLKLPYLILDIAIAFMLLHFFKDKKQQNLAFVFWLFNPFSIILIYLFSNVDIVPVALTVGSLIAARKEKLSLSALLLGIGAGFKMYPLILVPFLLLCAKSTKQKVLVILFSFGSFAFIVAPFLKSASFREAALSSGLTTRLFLPTINIGFNEMLMVAVVLMGILFFSAYFKGKESFRIEELPYYFLAVLLILVSSIHFHIQWLLWLMPFAAIIVALRNQFLNPVIIILSLAFAIPFLYNDKFMNVSLLSYISPFYNLLPTPFTMIKKFYDPYILQSVLHSLLVGGSLTLIWHMFRPQKP